MVRANAADYSSLPRSRRCNARHCTLRSLTLKRGQRFGEGGKKSGAHLPALSSDPSTVKNGLFGMRNRI
jgi:hypothetical protein